MAAGCGSGAAAVDAGGVAGACARTGRPPAAAGRSYLCAHIASPGAPGCMVCDMHRNSAGHMLLGSKLLVPSACTSRWMFGVRGCLAKESQACDQLGVAGKGVTI